MTNRNKTGQRSGHRTRLSSLRQAFATLILLVSVAACTVDLGDGDTCPLLCPQEQQAFVDTIIDVVALDTTLGPFPVMGISPTSLIASRGDTLQSYMVIRFDVLPLTFSPNNVDVQEPISTIDSTMLRFLADTTSLLGDSPFTIEVFDVDTTPSDSAASVIMSLFREDRKLTEIEVVPSSMSDTMRIFLPDSIIASKMINQQRLRVGLRIAPGTNSQIRLGSVVGGQPLPRLTFDPSSDTTYAPLDVVPQTTLEGAELDASLAMSYTVYTITPIASAPPPSGVLAVGGLPARRAYFGFNIPKHISDSSTVVRAELLLSQIPSASVDRGDSASIQPHVGISSDLITDLYTAAALSADGQLAGVDSVRLVPSGNGTIAVNLVGVVRSWSGLPPGVARAIILRAGREGGSGAEFLFHSIEAQADLRPRLRITYLPSSEFALP